MALPSSLSYCACMIRDHDNDRYICILFAPENLREAWFALFAFNHELASIAEIVSEEMIGLMRFAWWRDALDEIYSGHALRKHPVVEALAKTITQHTLPRALFDNLLNAREARLAATPFANASEWEPYFYATSSGLLQLCAATAGVKVTPALDALGMSWAYIGTARGAALAGEADNAMALAKASALQLQYSYNGLPAVFKPFAATIEFHLKRMGSGKPAKEAGVGLIFALAWKRMLRKI